MGVNNEFTADELKYFIEQKKFPPFTLTYLPDADASIHKRGPNDLKAIEKADQSIQEMLNSFYLGKMRSKRRRGLSLAIVANPL